MSRFSETMKNRLLASGVSERIHSPVSEGRGHWFFRPPFCNKILGDKSQNCRSRTCQAIAGSMHLFLYTICAQIVPWNVKDMSPLHVKKGAPPLLWLSRLLCWIFALVQICPGSISKLPAIASHCLVSLVTCSKISNTSWNHIWRSPVKICLAESSPLSGTPYALCLWPVRLRALRQAYINLWPDRLQCWPVQSMFSHTLLCCLLCSWRQLLTKARATTLPYNSVPPTSFNVTCAESARRCHKRTVKWYQKIILSEQMLVYQTFTSCIMQYHATHSYVKQLTHLYPATASAEFFPPVSSRKTRRQFQPVGLSASFCRLPSWSTSPKCPA